MVDSRLPEKFSMNCDKANWVPKNKMIIFLHKKDNVVTLQFIQTNLYISIENHKTYSPNLIKMALLLSICLLCQVTGQEHKFWQSVDIVIHRIQMKYTSKASNRLTVNYLLTHAFVISVDFSFK